MKTYIYDVPSSSHQLLELADPIAVDEVGNLLPDPVPPDEGCKIGYRRFLFLVKVVGRMLPVLYLFWTLLLPLS